MKKQPFPPEILNQLANNPSDLIEIIRLQNLRIAELEIEAAEWNRTAFQWAEDCMVAAGELSRCREQLKETQLCNTP